MSKPTIEDGSTTLAVEFSRQLWLQIGPKKLHLVVVRNAKEQNKDVCHSHDFCDANMAMHEAGKKLGYWTEEDDPQQFHELWSAAWSLAAKKKFFDYEKKAVL